MRRDRPCTVPTSKRPLGTSPPPRRTRNVRAYLSAWEDIVGTRYRAVCRTGNFSFSLYPSGNLCNQRSFISSTLASFCSQSAREDSERDHPGTRDKLREIFAEPRARASGKFLICFRERFNSCLILLLKGKRGIFVFSMSCRKRE